MPNLCRRARRSPTQSLQNSVISAISGLIRHATGGSTEANPSLGVEVDENKSQEVAISKTTESSKQRIGLYQSIKASVMDSSQKIRSVVSISSSATTITTTTTLSS